MKRLIIIAAILAFMAGCATTSPNTADQQDKAAKDSEIVKDIGTRGTTRP